MIDVANEFRKQVQTHSQQFQYSNGLELGCIGVEGANTSLINLTPANRRRTNSCSSLHSSMVNVSRTLRENVLQPEGAAASKKAKKLKLDPANRKPTLTIQSEQSLTATNESDEEDTPQTSTTPCAKTHSEIKALVQSKIAEIRARIQLLAKMIQPHPPRKRIDSTKSVGVIGE
ncbi:hypothetical protein HK098_005655 [Nowakowskiella sp. JEL0407]|nr:hypothetical protein HK098_005655 [Nowakowskiella sp. JEL0407]